MPWQWALVFSCIGQVELVDADRVDFNRDILPILADACYECHGPDAETRQTALRLDRRRSAMTRLESGSVAIVPGDALGSEVYQRIASSDPADRMPPPDSGRVLSDNERLRIRQWIDQGGAWPEHWAYVGPIRPPPPSVQSATWVRNAIDRFVAARLDAHNVQPSTPADRATLLRRVTLDLTGLPPTLDEIDRFIHDHRPGAYERLVDRLLASPRLGEHLATPWLDAARYADTHGYLFDTERSMWRWRDWVIDALNRNMSFDQFTIEQLAGDLIPHATRSQQIATGFNRNHLINNEAGAIAAEYLVENIVDRVNTTATVWMGLTLACCQCHDHKYDPFTQRDYYQLYAFFDNIPELGLDGLNSNARPFVEAPSENDVRELAELELRVADARAQFQSLSQRIAAAQAEWELTFDTSQPMSSLEAAAHWPLDASPAECVAPGLASTFEAAEPKYTDGLLGNALEFDGLGYLNANDRFDFEASDSFSIAAWIRPNTTEGRLTVVSRMMDAKSLFRGYAVQLVAGMPALFLLNSFPDDMLQVQAKTAIEANRWVHLVVTHDGTGKASGVKLYVDGQRQETGVVIDKLTGPIRADRPFWIGNGHPAAKFKGAIDEVRVYHQALTADQIASLPGMSVASLVAIDAESRNAEQQRRVRDNYLANHAPAEWSEPHRHLLALDKELAKRRRSLPTVMVMNERKQTRETRMLIRGDYRRPDEVVAADTPAVLPGMSDTLAKNRLGLARWLVSPKHPLTARVAANRIWQNCFGVGLVRTAEDFGVQGERPTHPELLDWLASELIEGGWDVKALLRLMVTSATYRQSSDHRADLVESDPGNHRLARSHRVRLPAETIRDQALAISGLLVERLGGASVKPYQPEGLWREVAFDFSGGNLTAQIYQPDTGSKLYRRSLYTFRKRTAPPPSMLLFDAPDRERCVVRRVTTETPLQSLVLMNDPTYVEAARKLAERMMAEPTTADPQVRLAYGFRLVTGQAPTNAETAALRGLYDRQVERFQSNPDSVQQLLSVGDSARNLDLNECRLGAYTMVASVLLNLDQTLMRR